MNFSKAFDLAKQGHGVKRSLWPDKEVIVKVQYPDENSKMTEPYLYMEKRNKRFPLDLSCESLFAEDWELVE